MPAGHLVLATAPQLPSLLSGTEAEDVGAGVAAVVGAGVADGEVGVAGGEVGVAGGEVEAEVHVPKDDWHPPEQ